MDSGVLMGASGQPFRNFGLMAAKEYFFANHVRRISLLLLMNLIPIDRKTNHVTIIQSLAACRDFMNNGNRNIIIYPEGTRSMSGEMARFKKGPAMIATELDVPLVPVHIRGTYATMAKGSRFIKPGRISVRIGQPIYPREYRQGNDEESNKQLYAIITKELEKRVHELKAQNIA